MFKILSAASFILTTFAIRMDHEASITLNADQQQWDKEFKANIKAIQNSDVAQAKTTTDNKQVFNYISPSKTNADKSTETSTWEFTGSTNGQGQKVIQKVVQVKALKSEDGKTNTITKTTFQNKPFITVAGDRFKA